MGVVLRVCCGAKFINNLVAAIPYPGPANTKMKANEFARWQLLVLIAASFFYTVASQCQGESKPTTR